jgi:hypothetical protein
LRKRSGTFATMKIRHQGGVQAINDQKKRIGFRALFLTLVPPARAISRPLAASLGKEVVAGLFARSIAQRVGVFFVYAYIIIYNNKLLPPTMLFDVFRHSPSCLSQMLCCKHTSHVHICFHVVLSQLQRPVVTHQAMALDPSLFGLASVRCPLQPATRLSGHQRKRKKNSLPQTVFLYHYENQQMRVLCSVDIVSVSRLSDETYEDDIEETPPYNPHSLYVSKAHFQYRKHGLVGLNIDINV